MKKRLGLITILILPFIIYFLYLEFTKNNLTENNAIENNFTGNIVPELKVCLVNHWSGSNATIKFYKILSDVFNELGFKLVEVKNNKSCDIAIDSVFGEENIKNKNAFKIFFTGEAKKPKIKGYDLSLGFSYIDNDKYMRLPLYYFYFNDKVSTNYKKNGTCNPQKKYFACFLVTAGNVKVRNNIFHALSLYKEVASGGHYLNNIGRNIPTEETNQFLSDCKFVIAYENNFTHEGYITEKAFQAYYAGAVPIYYSEPRAASDINKEAVVYRGDFNSDQDMIDYIKSLDQHDKDYCKKWNQPILIDHIHNYDFVKNALKDKILQSPKYNQMVKKLKKS